MNGPNKLSKKLTNIHPQGYVFAQLYSKADLYF